MCGRFNMTADPLARLFQLLGGADFPGPDRLNVAPTEQVPVVFAGEGVRAVAEMRWWLVPHWAKEATTRYAMFNARAETLEKSNAFRASFAHRRCVVPVTGFFEWLRGADGRKVPHYVVAAGGGGLCLAGLWDRWEGDGEHLESFTVVTTDAAPALRWLHDRQPALLAAEDAERWLAEDTPRETLRALLAPELPGPVDVYPMDPAMNNARDKGAACLRPTGEPRHLEPGDETD